MSKIKRKDEAKGSFVFRCDAKLIHADKGGGNRPFVWMMPHKRQGVQDLFNYSSDFASGNMQNFNRLSLWWKGKISITGKSITLHNYQPVLTMLTPTKSVGLALAIPLCDIALCFSCVYRLLTIR